MSCFCPECDRYWVHDVCPRQGWGMALKEVAGGNGSEEVWINLDFSAKIDKLSIGSRFQREANVLRNIPDEIHQQQIQPFGTWCQALACPEDSARPCALQAAGLYPPVFYLQASFFNDFPPHQLHLLTDCPWSKWCLVRKTLMPVFAMRIAEDFLAQLPIDLGEIASSNLVDLILAQSRETWRFRSRAAFLLDKLIVPLGLLSSESSPGPLPAAGTFEFCWGSRDPRMWTIVVTQALILLNEHKHVPFYL